MCRAMSKPALMQRLSGDSGSQLLTSGSADLIHRAVFRRLIVAPAQERFTTVGVAVNQDDGAAGHGANLRASGASVDHSSSPRTLVRDAPESPTRRALFPRSGY